MFKIMKYLFVINLYKRAKKQFVILVFSLATIILSSLILSDVMTVASGLSLYLLIALKWIIILSLMFLMVLSILKILELALPVPINTKQTNVIEVHNEAVNRKKEIILNKGRIFTESDMILQKYTRDAK